MLDKIKDGGKRVWYIHAANKHGWSRAILEHRIESGLFERQGQAQTNFERTLLPLQSDLAQQVLKDGNRLKFIFPHPFIHHGYDSQERGNQFLSLNNILRMKSSLPTPQPNLTFGERHSAMRTHPPFPGRIAYAECRTLSHSN